MTEAELHKLIVDYLQIALQAGSVVHHSPNEGRHKVAYRAKQKRLGMRAGWPDLEAVFRQRRRPCMPSCKQPAARSTSCAASKT